MHKLFNLESRIHTSSLLLSSVLLLARGGTHAWIFKHRTF